jgi:hypothetical protein
MVCMYRILFPVSGVSGGQMSDAEQRVVASLLRRHRKAAHTLLTELRV